MVHIYKKMRLIFFGTNGNTKMHAKKYAKKKQLQDLVTIVFFLELHENMVVGMAQAVTLLSNYLDGNSEAPELAMALDN